MRNFGGQVRRRLAEGAASGPREPTALMARLPLGGTGTVPRWERVGLGSAAAALTATAAVLSSAHPEVDRPVLAVAIGVALVSVGTARPRVAIVATMSFLPLLGLVRRLLIAEAGWSSYDPLLLVAPAVAACLLARSALTASPLPGSLIARLVIAVGLFTVLEIANPNGGGIAANTTGLLFVAAPLAWFFVGRRLCDDVTVGRVLMAAVVAAGAIACYGLSQAAVGLPSWDEAWVSITDYASLNVGDQIRPFGTFASAAEYATYLGVALVVCVAWTTFGRPWLLLLAPLFGAAIAYESSRGVAFLALLAVVVVLGARTGRARWLAIVIAFGVASVIAANGLLGSSLSQSQRVASSPLLSHQVAGLTDPLNPSNSTLLLHWQIVVDGMLGSVSHPLGLGPGATNLASAGGAGAPNGTEVDASNAFVNLGIVGGALYLTLIGAVLWKTGRLALATRAPAALAVLGVLLVSLGQWLNGGYYALAPLVWLLVGWADRRAQAAA